MDVVLVRWPDEAEARSRLADEGRPRLLLVDHDTPPPRVDDELEDWIRVPASELDLHARVEALDRRARSHDDDRPELDEDGVLRFGRAWVSLPPVEGRLMEAMIGRYRSVVSRDALGRAGWPSGGSSRRNALDVHMLRLRRRVAPIGLVIQTVRSRGYLLEGSGSGNGALAHR
jgi:DNA-binding response OmpR family regulator